MPTAAVEQWPTADAPLTRSDAVRKTVTLLFCDLVGSTALAARIDAESAREAMSRYHTMAQGEIEAHGGTVAKFIGDGVMALFGVPEVAVDDAERAVMTGQALQREFLPIAEHIDTRYGVEVGLRVGINTGEVVIADDDADIVGDSLNTAARLEAACTPGQVLVGEDTWRLTRSSVRYEQLGNARVKGKNEPVATFQVLGITPNRASAATPFVGRDRELAVLMATFEESVAKRTVRLATVIGAPGVGKTRLARELHNTVGDRAQVIGLRCERAGTATFAPIADLLRVVALDETDDDEVTQADLEAVVSELDDAGRVAGLLAGFVGAADLASEGLRWLSALVVKHAPVGQPKMARIWELRDSVTPYDAAYLAITERLQAVTGGQACLATADRKLARSPAVRCPVELYTTDG